MLESIAHDCDDVSFPHIFIRIQVVHEVATTLLIAQQVDSAVFDSFVQTLLPANAAKQLVTLLSIAKGLIFFHMIKELKHFGVSGL